MKKTLILLILPLIIFSCTSYFEEGESALKLKDYETANSKFLKVEKSDEHYNDAQKRLKELGEIFAKLDEERFKQDSLDNVSAQKEKLATLKKELNFAILTLKDFEGNKYLGDATAVTNGANLFKEWSALVEKASFYDKESKELGLKLKNDLVKTQKSFLPKMRKSYIDYVAKELWRENITVTSKGVGSTTVEFEGATFASNKNIESSQEAFTEIFNLLRFKRVNYKWFEYDDQYTYYTLKTLADKELY
jgi:hypothetical protein